MKNLYGTELPYLDGRANVQYYEGKNLAPYQKLVSRFNSINMDNVGTTFPNWMGQFAAIKSKQTKMDNYLEKIKAEGQNKNSKYFTEAASLMPDMVKYDETKKRWYLTDDKLDSKVFKGKNTAQLVKRLDEANTLMSKQYTEQDILNYVPPLVQSIITADKNFSKAGIGQKSPTSLPFYAGRWVDETTGRIRLLPRASTKYLNPISYQQRLQYYQARVLNKWN